MRRRFPPAGALALAFLAAGCGGARGVPRPSLPPPSPAERAPSAVPSPAGPHLRQVRLALEPVATLQQPVAMAVRAGDPTLYVAQKTGEVMAVRVGRMAPAPVLDLSGEVSDGTEQGLLGIAFSPDGRFLFVNFTDLDGDTHVERFDMADGRADPSSRRRVLFVEQPFANHNGGNLAFGPDGYLYVGVGDGGSAGDPEGNAQDLGTLLGKMLRIDPLGEGPYAVPADNPFVDVQGARPEIWAFGLRNPWRYSFDRDTGDLWIGDVGQSAREEIDVQPASSDGGENYGWDRLEGTLPFEGSPPPQHVVPIYDYPRDLGTTVIGGYVYRGGDIPALRGAYVFGDYSEPGLVALVRGEGRAAQVRPLGVEVPALVSFGEDHDGELYAIAISGDVYRLVPG